jgi:hypothetical protein
MTKETAMAERPAGQQPTLLVGDIDRLTPMERGMLDADLRCGLDVRLTPSRIDLDPCVYDE